MKSKHVAILGSTGQVGSPLTKALLKEGHRVQTNVQALRKPLAE